EHGVVCLFSAEALDTLASRNPHTGMTDSILLEYVHQRCFTDTRFTGYKDHLAAATPCAFKTLGQFAERCFASHHMPGGFGREPRGRDGALLRDLGQKPVAALRHGLDE